MSHNKYVKVPGATLDYVFDWADWLALGEEIVSHTIIAETGITVASSSNTTSKVTVWLSGGTANTEYNVECEIVTSVNRVDRRTIRIYVQANRP